MYIKVKVYPDQKNEEFKEISENRFEARVKMPASQNLANTRVLELVAGYLKVPKNKVKIISGHHHPNKILAVEKE